MTGAILMDAARKHLDGFAQVSGSELEELRTLRTEVLALLEHPDAIRVREGGGPENLAASLASTFVALRERALPRTLTPAVAEALGFMIFDTGPIADGFRKDGRQIERKAEAEQAYVLHWMLGYAIKHGEGWKKIAAEDLPTSKRRTPKTQP
jgi:hypothetical protein